MHWPWRREAPPETQFDFPQEEAVHRPGTSSRSGILALTSLLILASGVGLAAGLAYLREDALAAGERLNRSLAHVLEEQTSRTLQGTDQGLQLATVRLQALETAGAASPDTVSQMLRDQIAGLPFVRAMWVIDADGNTLYNSDPSGLRNDVGDREYYAVHRNGVRGFHLSRPMRSRVNQQWLLTASRPLLDESGNFRGSIVAALHPPYFDRLWGQLDLGEDGAVALWRRDATLLMRSPMDDAAMGRSFAATGTMFSARVAQQPAGSSIVRSAVDGRTRVGAYRSISAYPELVVTVGRGESALLRPWQRFALFSTLFWLAASAAVVLLTFRQLRQLRQRERSERRFVQLAQAMPQIVFITDPVGRLTFVSEQWRQVTGEPVSVAVERGWMHRIHPDDRERAAQNIRDTRRNGVNVPNEQRLLCHDGVYRWQLSRAVANRDAIGRITSWYGTFTDIDELKQAEAALKRQTELVRMAGRLSRLGGWALELPSMQFLWSDEASEILSLPRGAAPTLSQAIELCAPASRDLATRVTQACLEQGVPFDIEVQMQTPQGLIWVRSMGHAVRDANGAIVRMQGALQDVSQRIRAERELRAHLQTSQRAAEAAPAVVQAHTLDGLMQTLAQKARTTLAAQECVVSLRRPGRAELLVRDLAPPHDDAHDDAHDDMHGDTQDGARNEAGTASPGDWLTAPLSERDGQPMGMLRVAGRPGSGFSQHDDYVLAELAHLASITVHNLELLAQVRELNASLESRIATRTGELRAANAELEAFSYSVSHDLRSPLGTVDGFTRLLTKELEGNESPKVRHYIARIQAGVSHMGALIDGLLTLAHLSRVEVRRDPVDLSAIASEILERLQAGDPTRGVAWSVEPGLRAQGDSRLIRAALENLLNNAWKFTSGRAIAEISVGLSEAHEAFFVRDNGAGFDMAYAGKLFGAFQRLHDAREFPGTGIGLATVARVMSRHGGRVWAESAPDAGTTMYFTLPGPNASPRI
jgi:PAS domain S-box-containing protein